jgi:hypothetical protein
MAVDDAAGRERPLTLEQYCAPIRFLHPQAPQPQTARQRTTTPRRPSLRPRTRPLPVGRRHPQRQLQSRRAPGPRPGGRVRHDRLPLHRVRRRLRRRLADRVAHAGARRRRTGSSGADDRGRATARTRSRSARTAPALHPLPRSPSQPAFRGRVDPRHNHPAQPPAQLGRVDSNPGGSSPAATLYLGLLGLPSQPEPCRRRTWSSGISTTG